MKKLNERARNLAHKYINEHAERCGVPQRENVSQPFTRYDKVEVIRALRFLRPKLDFEEVYKLAGEMFHFS